MRNRYDPIKTPDGREISQEELNKHIEEFEIERACREAVTKIVHELKELLHKHRLPGAIIVARKIWVPTGMWRLANVQIVGNFSAEIQLDLIWMTPEGTRSIDPVNPGVRPDHFGPGFEGRHSIFPEFRLTEMPTTQSGSATGGEPGIHEDAHPKLRQLLEEEIYKLDWIEKEP